MSEGTQYRTFVGIVQFDPVDREAAGKDVRNVTIRQVGMKDQAQLVSITLWPTHEHIKVAKGDIVIVDGKFAVNKGKDGEGNPKTYFNVSANAFAVIGKADYGVEVESTGDDSGDGDDEDTW
jgi:hypothetical protein